MAEVYLISVYLEKTYRNEDFEKENERAFVLWNE